MDEEEAGDPDDSVVSPRGLSSSKPGSPVTVTATTEAKPEVPPAPSLPPYLPSVHGCDNVHLLLQQFSLPPGLLHLPPVPLVLLVSLQHPVEARVGRFVPVLSAGPGVMVVVPVLLPARPLVPAAVEPVPQVVLVTLPSPPASPATSTSPVSLHVPPVSLLTTSPTTALLPLPSLVLSSTFSVSLLPPALPLTVFSVFVFERLSAS